MKAPLSSATVPKTAASSLCGQAVAGTNAKNRAKNKLALELKKRAKAAKVAEFRFVKREWSGVTFITGWTLLSAFSQVNPKIERFVWCAIQTTGEERPCRVRMTRDFPSAFLRRLKQSI